MLHDDAEREFAYGPADGLPDTKVGTFSQALMDAAKRSGWTVISMKNDWKTIFAGTSRRRSERRLAPLTKGVAPMNRVKNSATFATAFAAAMLMAGAAAAQSSAPKPNIPLEKTIGEVTPTGPVPSLAVINSAGATLVDGKLTLKGVSKNSIVFADRPVRAAGHVMTAQFIMQWDPDKRNFAIDPPNATVSVLDETTTNVADAVVTLTAPKLEGDDLTFDVTVLEGGLEGASGPAALFIDRFGGFGGGFRGGDFHGSFGHFGNASFAHAGDYHANDFRGGDDYYRGNDYYHGGTYWHAPDYHGAWYGAGDVAAGAIAGAAVGTAIGAAADAPYYGAPNYVAPYAPAPDNDAPYMGKTYGPKCGYYPYPPCY